MWINTNADDAEPEIIVEGGSGNVVISNNLIVQGNQYTPSDIRLKSNVKSYKQGLSLIAALNPVSYEYNVILNTPVGETKIGLIAQELQSIAPDLVQTRNNLLSINTDALPYILVNAVRELDTKNRLLELQSERQNVQIADLQTRLKEMEALLEALVASIETLSQTASNQDGR